jgi:hypothetical protein
VTILGVPRKRNLKPLSKKLWRRVYASSTTPPLYSSGKAEERYGKFLTPRYRDVSFIMTKTLAKK